MNIVFLSKRQYMSKDVILDRYARLYEIPNQLSCLGHQVLCYCLSYQKHAEGVWDESDLKKSLIWHSKSYLGIKRIFIIFYPLYLLHQIKKNPPDIIIAASDIPHIILGAWLAKQLGVKFVVDLYDNFESYGQARIPLLKQLFAWALKSAEVISTTSSTLAKKIKTNYPNVPTVFALPSTIDSKSFYVADQYHARQQLNLPRTARLIGTAGGLTKMKAIDDLFKAWALLSKQSIDIFLVLAGPTETNTPIPVDPKVIYLGMLPHPQINLLFQALDVGVLCIPDNEFGRYCFPQKAYEMLATALPIVSTAVGDMSEILPENCLYPAGQHDILAKKILQQLAHKYTVKLDVPDWERSIALLNQHLLSIFKK